MILGREQLMFLFELRKLIRSKLFIISTAIVLLMFVLQLAGCIFNEDNLRSAAEFDEYINSHPLTEEYLSELKERNAKESKEYYAALGSGSNSYQLSKDYFIESSIVSRLEYAERYKSDMIDMVKRNLVMRNAESSERRTLYQSAVTAYNTVIKPEIVNKEVFAAFFSPHSGPQLFGAVLTAWAALLTAYLLCCERGVVYSSQKGRAALYLCKISALTAVIFSLLAVMLITELMTGALVFKIDLFAPVQSHEMLEYCPYNLTVAGLYLLTYLTEFFGVMFGVFITSLVCIRAASPVRGTVVGLILGAAAYAGTGYINYLSSMPGETAELSNTLRMFFPSGLTDVMPFISRFDHTLLFTAAVPRFAVTMAVTVIFGTAAIIISAKLYGRSADIRWKAKLLSLIKSPKATEA